MPTYNTAAASSAASAAAAISAANAHRAHVSECRAVMATFEPKGSTVLEMREYAECVQFIHPAPKASTGDRLAAVAFVVAFIIGAVVTWFRLADERDMSFRLVGVFLGGLVGCAILAILFGVVYVFGVIAGFA